MDMSNKPTEEKAASQLSRVRRRHASNKDVFLKPLKQLINNLLIENKNYENYYTNINCSDWERYHKFKEDTIERAKYILERIEDTEHLLDDA